MMGDPGYANQMPSPGKRLLSRIKNRMKATETGSRHEIAEATLVLVLPKQQLATLLPLSESLPAFQQIYSGLVS